MKKFYAFLLRIFIILLIIIVYARYVGTSGLITKEYTLSEDIPSGFDGMKIVHFSDVHFNRAITIDKVNEIVDEINLIDPDIVVFTGDLIDKDVELDSDDFKVLTDSLSRITAKYGKYAVTGNHDDENIEEITDILNNSGFNYLDNSYDLIYDSSDEIIFIGGIGNVTNGKDDIDKALEYLKDKEEKIYTIVLVHEPDISTKIVKDYEPNIILAGHSHGGQIRLPFVGAIYTPEYAKKYYDEYYKIGNTSLYVSSGIGVSTVNYRLWNRPSINFYRINKEEVTE
jgi:predicted MPP superfamily phosphohydrolase